ncbi:MAG: hypothetical protein JO256_00880 [Alphaproteobacteria bacterium]|nr:hypothetical protein [Alphaproteobacteria bacterium]
MADRRKGDLTNHADEPSQGQSQTPGADFDFLVSCVDPAREELMESLGISHSLTLTFHYRGYSYQKLDDAIAQALRDKAE